MGSVKAFRSLAERTISTYSPSDGRLQFIANGSHDPEWCSCEQERRLESVKGLTISSLLSFSSSALAGVDKCPPPPPPTPPPPTPPAPPPPFPVPAAFCRPRSSSSCRVNSSTFATARESSFSFSLNSALMQSRSEAVNIKPRRTLQWKAIFYLRTVTFCLRNCTEKSRWKI